MITVESLSRYYGETAAIAKLSFTVQPNTVVGFLGRNGAGKSTTLKILAGLLEPSEGTVHINTQELHTSDERFRKQIGYLPEEPPLYREMTVRDYLYFLGGLRGMTKTQLNARVPALMQLCQIADRSRWVIETLSLGYRKRVGIAQAILHEPKLIILDEPTSGLDPQQIKGMRELIRSLAKEATVLLSSHHLSEVAETCDQLLILNDGLLIDSGTAEELAARSQQHSMRLELSLLGESSKIEESIAQCDGASLVKLSSETPSQVIIDLNGIQPEVMVKQLVLDGIGVRSVQSSTQELEHIFLALTGGPQ